jgi:exosortase/archaeosortase
MALSYIKRKRNPFLISLIVAVVFFVLHLTISLLRNRANLTYSFVGAAIFFVLYFIFQMIQNLRIDRAKKKADKA